MATDKNLKREKVWELVNAHIKPGGRVLEISCGEGKTLERLQQDGYVVRGTNYSKYPDAIKSVEIDEGVDIFKGMPYDNESFDCVILSDVIEHFPDHNAAIKEIARVMKIGGQVIILTPNTLKTSSRLSFLFTGFFKIKRAFVGFDVPAEKAFTFHNNPPHLPTFLYLLHSNFLECIKVDAVGYKVKSYFFWLIFFPLIMPMTYFKTHVAEKNIKVSGTSPLLFSTLTSFKTLCGEYWITVSRKVDASARPNIIKTKLPKWVEKS
ncbi:MAG: class I SAM-dependent methyltransferase [Candidatus Brocadiaceae bacterium]|nr:class I SAM-dependent methyltransferase [Candidatus Brocadiaceae bacterium]